MGDAVSPETGRVVYEGQRGDVIETATGSSETVLAARDARASRGRKVSRRLGVGILFLGAAVLLWAYVTWEWGDPVTGLYTRYRQGQLRDQLAVIDRQFQRTSTRDPSSSGTGRNPSPVTAAKPNLEAAALRLRRASSAGSPVGRIRVSRLGLDAVFVEGTDHESLRSGPGVDPRSHLPGEGQLVYIAGHRTTYGAPFAHIDELRRGDRIELDMPYGRFIYRVSGYVIVPANDIGRLRSRGWEEVALQACYPRFSARERYIVYAQPVSAKRA